MRIAIFSDNFYPELSGITDSIIVLAKNLIKLGHFVDFFVPKYSRRNFLKANVAVEEINLGSSVKIHRLFSFPYPSPTKQGRMVVPIGASLLKIRKRKPDIIHTQLFFGVGIEALITAKILKLPLVGTNHTPITEFTRYSPIKNRLLDWLGLRYVAWYYNRCDYVTAPNQGIFKEMEINGFKKPYRVISNPIEIDNFFPVTLEKKRQLKASYSLSENTVIYAGRLSPEKHIDVLIKAIARVKEIIPNIDFVITGHGVSAESLKNLAKKLGLDKNVKFFGTVDNKTHAQLYQASDIFAIASTAEMQSLSLMKAMSCGLPVIGVRAWALPEYINKDNGFITDVGDFKSIADKIIYLIKNLGIKEKLGQGGLLYVKNFSQEKIAKEWESIYLSVIKDKER